MAVQDRPQAGLDVRQVPADAQTPIEASGSAVDLHRRLLEDVGDAIIDAARECPGDRRDDHRQVLREVGVTALDGRLADAIATLAAGTDPSAQSAPAHAHRDVIDLLEGMGSGHVDGQPSGRDDLFEALPPLLSLSSTTPTLSVRLGIEWASADARDRAAVLRYLCDLSTGARIVLAISDAAAHRIVETHADVVPTWLLTKCADRRGSQPAPDAERDARQAAADARETLSPDARPMAVVRHLARSSTQSLSYDRLASRMALDDPPHESVRRLEDDHGLVERTERADGTRVVSLRPAGWQLVQTTDGSAPSEDRLTAVSSAASGVTSGAKSGVSHPPENPAYMPCFPSAWDPPQTAGTDLDSGEGTERPDGEGDAVTDDADRRDRYHDGMVTARYGDRMDWIPAAEVGETGDLALVDVDFCDRMADDRDGREPIVSYVEEDDAIHVAAEYCNPKQFATALAHGLTSERLFAADDWAGRIGRDLEGLEISEREVLWSATCVGWCPAEIDDGSDWLDEIRDGRDALCRMSGLTDDPESDVSRSEVTKQALGMIGTMIQVFDLLGVDVLLEARIGKESSISKHYGEGNPGRRDDLLEHISTLAALCSRVGAFSAFRQLFETRESHRSDAFTPGFEANKDTSSGSMQAGIVVTGDGVESLAGDLRQRLESPRPIHDDAPPLSIPIDVRAGVDHDRYRSTVRRLLEARGLRETPAAVMVLRAFDVSAWAAAEGLLLGIEAEDRLREVDLFEVRRALGVVDSSRLLPDVDPSARAGVGTLLEAERPISQAEIGRRTDGCSSKSWSNHKNALVAADIARETDDGWRLALPFKSERSPDDLPDVANPPWYLRAEADDAPFLAGDPEMRRASDILWWIVERLDIDVDRQFDPDDPIGYAFEDVDDVLDEDVSIRRCDYDLSVARDTLDLLGLPPGVLLAGAPASSRSRGPPPTARMGSTTGQTSLPV